MQPNHVRKIHTFGPCDRCGHPAIYLEQHEFPQPDLDGADLFVIHENTTAMPCPVMFGEMPTKVRPATAGRFASE